MSESANESCATRQRSVQPDGSAGRDSDRRTEELDDRAAPHSAGDDPARISGAGASAHARSSAGAESVEARLHVHWVENAAVIVCTIARRWKFAMIFGRASSGPQNIAVSGGGEADVH